MNSRVDLLHNGIERRERRQFDLLLDQAVDGCIDDVHRLIHRLGGLMCRAYRDFVGIGAVVGLDAEKFADCRIVTKQGGRPCPVVAECGLGAYIRARPDVLDDNGGNGVNEGKVVHLLKDLQQNQQAQSRGLATRVAAHPLKLFDVRRIERLQFLR